ncbi:hypothetical protein RGQ29_002487 [Quercus rubra]|uniref:RING-type domain-containing protein n=1 Tax=Quercus rubra TaxID=3512 RepID=A0AAN7EAE9_QUERU|nr:hypothetical protein RGQ29_002487 [Quercus rubra]
MAANPRRVNPRPTAANPDPRDNIVVDGDDDEEEEDVVVIDVGLGQAPAGHNPDPLCVSPVSSGSGMNLAAALAAERHLRASHEPERVATVGPTDTTVGIVGGTTTAPRTPFRVSLMRLLEETDGGDEEMTMMTEKEKEREKGGVEGNDSVCCVCMVRKKGAAFIPCGHTFCRVCSRELWLNRGSCPLFLGLCSWI